MRLTKPNCLGDKEEIYEEVCEIAVDRGVACSLLSKKIGGITS